MVRLSRTETLSLLQELPPEKLAPPNTYAFALVLVSLPPQPEYRVISAICRACGVSEAVAAKIQSHPLPTELKRGMTHADAAIGQFELLACDSLALIIADRVIENPPPGYLAELYRSLAASSDSELIEATIAALPTGTKASEFLDLFLGDAAADWSVPRRVMRRKALLMRILAERIGGQVLLG